jgi:uncharacterized PurR-regulated membrane protein YhhQ (DUF165 family)
VFGVISKERLKYTILYSLFMVSLTSATIGIRDVHNFVMFGIHLTFTVGVIFFPLTFVISNIIQEEYDIDTANTVVFSALLTDLIMVSMLYLIAFFGDSKSYHSIFGPLPYVWMVSFISILISCFINNAIFKKIRNHFNVGFVGILVSILTSSIVAETILPIIALPFLLAGKNNIYLFSAIALAFGYKLVVTAIASFLVAIVKGAFQYRSQVREYLGNR